MRNLPHRLILIVILIYCCFALNGSSIPQSNLKLVQFGGYQWKVSDSTEPQSPGPNYFSANSDNVWVDILGRLHLKVTYENGRWNCASLELDHKLGVGTYTFDIEGDFTTLDENIIVGLFLYQSDTKEYDIEFSKWGNPNQAPLQYSVQPSLSQSYPVTMRSDAFTIHTINWTSHLLRFRSYYNSQQKGNLIADWKQKIPSDNQITSGSLDLNMWLYGSKPMKENSTKEIVISNFTFSPPS